MSALTSRLDPDSSSAPGVILCDSWTVEGVRSEAHPTLGEVLGRWPERLECDAVRELAVAAEDEASLRDVPAMVQGLTGHATPQPLDLAIEKHWRMLKTVCHKPRLRLRVEEARLPVSQARRVPARAVADLVSHPGDWEHRTFQTIRPSRVLTRYSEDDWNLYENRVAARLVDHLLEYLSRRIEKLSRVEDTFRQGRDLTQEIAGSFWRARRISQLWGVSDAERRVAEETVAATRQRLERLQFGIRGLLDSPLYKQIPRSARVPTALKPTNILTNDSAYRRVATLWRAWAKHGFQRPETSAERLSRRQAEASAWDRFVLHLIVRYFASRDATADSKGKPSKSARARWSLIRQEDAWTASRPGFLDVTVALDSYGAVCVRIREGPELRIVPLCADLAGVGAKSTLPPMQTNSQRLLVHCGLPALPANEPNNHGWFEGGHALLGVSPWRIDSEERMARALEVWMAKHALETYPVSAQIPALAPLPSDWRWLSASSPSIVHAWRPPDGGERASADEWLRKTRRALSAEATRARSAKIAFEPARLTALDSFAEFLERAKRLSGFSVCPVCATHGAHFEDRPDEGDPRGATWWATCTDCGAAWGLVRCGQCGSRHPRLVASTGVDANLVPADAAAADRLYGRDVWGIHEAIGSGCSARREPG